MERKAVQFGAGNIGRGFLGQLFFETGYATTFVDVVDDLVTALDTRKEYPLRIVGGNAPAPLSEGEKTATLTIGNVRALHASDIEAVAAALAEADLAATAVGVGVLPKVAPLIAAGVARRFRSPSVRYTDRLECAPLNIIVCENMIGAGPYLREQVRGHLDPAFHEALDRRVGFVEASIGRMVPAMTDKEKAEDPLLVCVEAYCELPVDANGFKGAVPPLKHMAPHRNFEAYVERKLFVHNAGHATTAYLGYLRSYEFIWQAIADPIIRREADAAMAETRAGLVAKHGLRPEELEKHWADLVRRFSNKALGDQVARVAKDPIRKLGPKDRLIGAMTMCLEQGIEPHHVAFAAAAAILYDCAADQAAQRLQELRRIEGLDAVFKAVCGIEPDGVPARLIREGLKRIEQEGWLRI